MTQQYADGLLSMFRGRANSMGKALGLAEERIQVRHPQRRAAALLENALHQAPSPSGWGQPKCSLP